VLKNYYKVDENKSVGSFLKEVNEKKNSQYLILDTNPLSFVDIRTIALKSHNFDEKLKSLKKPLANSNGKTDSDYFKFLLECGDRVIKTKDSYFDFLDALEIIKNGNFDFLNDNLEINQRSEIFALNEKDKISVARNLMIKNRINLLPVIDKLKVVGEVRTMDFLVNNLIDSSANKADLYDKQISGDILNLPISNLSNNKPITIESSKTYLDAINLMIKKKLGSLIITSKDNLYSIISYKDIFRLVKKDQKESKYLIEYVGATQVYDDELDLIKDYSERSMDKISNMSNYDSLKVSLKTHGNTEGTHQKKISVNLLLSYGNHVLHVDKEIIQGSSDEFTNNKIKGKWNVPLLVMDSLSILEKKVRDESRKN